LFSGQQVILIDGAMHILAMSSGTLFAIYTGFNEYRLFPEVGFLSRFPVQSFSLGTTVPILW
jgi:hypothetical protein